MLVFGLYPNTKKKDITTVLTNLIQYFDDRNVKILLPDDAAKELNFPDLACSREQMKGEISLGITMGGDGTLLNNARDIAPAGIPVCGINMGKLGYLTEVEMPDIYPSIDRLILGDYFIEERLMIEAVILHKGNEMHLPPALNDVVVTKGGISRLIRLKLYIDDEFTAKYPADGLIVATSTGSTGYSLSAGGPIINPNLKVIVLTPICPHTLHARPMVISENEEIKIAFQATTHDEIVLTMDGQIMRNLQPDDIIIVRRSPYRARFARLGGSNITRALRTKKLWQATDDDC